MEAFALKGVWAPLLTPYSPSGEINESEYRRLTEYVLDNGMQGVFVGGTTGEFVNLTIEERQTLLSAAAQVAAPGQLLYNITAMNLRDMRRLAEWGRNHGAGAFSVTAPYYHKYDAASLIEYFCTVAQLAGDMPLYLYNMSGMTNNPITPAILRTVTERCPNVRGIKDSSMDFMTLLDYQVALQGCEGFEIVTGNDAQVYYALCAGAAGGIIAVASVFPRISSEIWSAWQAGEREKAREAQNKVLSARQAFRSVMPVMAHKYALELQGFTMGKARFPFRDLFPEEKKTLARELHSAGLL